MQNLPLNSKNIYNKLKTVLFLESGIHGGGSFISLKKHIEALDYDKIRPIVIFFNQNKLQSFFVKKNIKTFIIRDSVFSSRRKNLSKFLNALFMKGYIPFGVISYLQFLHRKSIQEISDICLQENVEHIHLNTELFRDRIGLLVGRKLSLPIISYLRSKYEAGRISYNKDYINFANKNVRQYVAVSKDTKNFWTNDVKIQEDKCCVIYDYFKPVSLSKNDFVKENEKINFLCVANLIPVKGHFFLLRSLAPILKKYNITLNLAGHGEEEYIHRLKNIIEQLDIDKHVNLMGFQTDIPLLLSQADIVLLFSKREGLPNILIESLGLGCIVVATKVGGIPEIIENGINGYTVPYGNKIEARRTIEYLLKNIDSLAKVRKMAKHTVASKFSREDYKNKINFLYE